MKPLTLALISAAGYSLTSGVVARPIIGFHGTCSFNGVSEACFIRESTDQIEVTYASDNKRVIYMKPQAGMYQLKAMARFSRYMAGYQIGACSSSEQKTASQILIADRKSYAYVQAMTSPME